MEITREIMAKLAASAEGMPVYLDRREPELEDPASKLAPHQWRPACTTTSKLTRCLEAVRDLSSTLVPLSTSPRPEVEKRFVKQAVIPLYNLAIALRDLFNDVQSTRWQKLTKRQQEKLVKRFKQFGEAVPTKDGTLKAARDKIAAHLDKDFCTSEYRQFWDAFGLPDVLAWVRSCFRLMESLLRPDLYRWTRFSGYTDVWNLMNVDGNEISLLIEDERPAKIVGIQLVVSPKAGIVREARELAAACTALEDRLGISNPFATEEPEERSAGSDEHSPDV